MYYTYNNNTRYKLYRFRVETPLADELVQTLTVRAGGHQPAVDEQAVPWVGAHINRFVLTVPVSIPVAVVVVSLAPILRSASALLFW
jgi:hypothetical protein